MTDIFDIIFRRRSIRKYQDRPVPREMLVNLLKAGMAAPSAVDKKPWEFVVVTEQAQLAALQDLLPFGKYTVPAAIVVCGRLDLAHTEPDGSYWMQDCSAATENILLAAVGLGLGTVWTGVYPVKPRAQQVQQLLGLPEFCMPLGVILVGYPDEEKEARTQYDESRVHWEHY